MKSKKSVLSMKEVAHAISIYKEMVASNVKNISIFEIRSSRDKNNINNLISGTVRIGLVIVRTDKNYQDWFKMAFVQDFCMTAYGSPIFFTGEEGDKASLEWMVELLDDQKLNLLGGFDKLSKTTELFAVIEPPGTLTPYFGKLNHFVRNSKVRQSSGH